MLNTPLLEKIDEPADLRRLPESILEELAEELRQFLIHTVSKSGGHFASNLGAIELTIALHYIYNTPADNLVWDIGHQAYAHKILTGRRRDMHTLRQWNGIAPFTKRDESSHDVFGAGHSSTSISAALGMAIAAKQQGVDKKNIAIIGDGGLTAGMAFEALNHAGGLAVDLLVVLNDNNMSISPNVGALSSKFSRLISSKFYRTIKEEGKKFLSNMPNALNIMHHTEEHIKGLFVPGILFEELGFNYIGPVDGHDLPALLAVLKNIRRLKGLQFLHVLTKKGKGYMASESEPVKYHGVTAFDPARGIDKKSKPDSPTYSEVFGDWIIDMSSMDERIVAITPAMREGSGLVNYEKKFPHRYFDVGIAEQHSITLAAGMACAGLKPVVAIYSTFLQRGYDQLIHDVALQNLAVLFAIDRSGCVGADGPTHNGIYDLSFMRCLPNMVVMVPADENECRQMLYTGVQIDGPVAVRYPRGAGPGVEVNQELSAIAIGRGEIKRQGRQVAILAFGAVLEFSRQAGEELEATVVNMRFVKPIDEELILTLAAGHDLLVTVEENVVQGGAGSAVNEVLVDNGVTGKIINYGLPDRLIQHGSRMDMLNSVGMNKDGLLAFINRRLRQNKSSDRE